MQKVRIYSKQKEKKKKAFSWYYTKIVLKIRDNYKWRIFILFLKYKLELDQSLQFFKLWQPKFEHLKRPSVFSQGLSISQRETLGTSLQGQAKQLAF